MRVVTLGESMGLIRTIGIGSFSDQDSARIDTGGAEGNVAVGLSRLGVACTWLGRVGDDSLGRRVIRDLRGEGVDVRAIIDNEAPTGLMLKENARRGSTTVTYYRRGSAGGRLCPDDLDKLDIEKADMLHVTGITLAISESARQAVRVAVGRAQAAGVRVSFDVNHRSRLWNENEASQVYREIASSSDILFAGDDEACLTLETTRGRAARDIAFSLARLGPSEVVLKHGGAGASTWVSGEFTNQSAQEVEVVDTVGAGDAFVAGYLAEVLGGATIEQRLRTAVLAGALACLHPGDWQGSARRDELGGEVSEPVSR